MSVYSVKVGDVTLCQHCGKAIRLERSDRDDGLLTLSWQHFVSSDHGAVPKWSMWDYDAYGERLPASRLSGQVPEPTEEI